MAKWNEDRTQRARYQAGIGLILTGTAFSLTGILTPGWLTFHPSASSSANVTVEGLFIQCAGHFAQCRVIDVMEVKGYEKWSHVIISMGVIALLMSSLFICVIACDGIQRRRSLKVVEGFAVYGGFFVFVGVLNYVANNHHSATSSYGYGFFLTALASVVSVTGGILVALANRALTLTLAPESGVEAGRETADTEVTTFKVSDGGEVSRL